MEAHPLGRTEGGVDGTTPPGCSAALCPLLHQLLSPGQAVVGFDSRRPDLGGSPTFSADQLSLFQQQRHRAALDRAVLDAPGTALLRWLSTAGSPASLSVPGPWLTHGWITG